ncbi:hypothetical protein CMK22_05975, partial [Candidatus Poribacteria bacterium]|nr:hypothetical protein [Candidatus Poribacteria bacterium]
NASNWIDFSGTANHIDQSTTSETLNAATMIVVTKAGALTPTDSNAGGIQLSDSSVYDEVLVFDRVLTDSEKTQINTYLIGKWGVSGSSGSGNEIFSYTGSVQTFTSPSGVTSIQIEAWGAEGGGRVLSGNSASGLGGKGGYSSGTLSVTPNQDLYVYVGGHGSSSTNGVAAGGWNGGGSGHASSSGEPGNGGGGATDVRTVNGSWNDATSLASRVIVAAGGGGGGEDPSDLYGYGGGLTGSGYSSSYDATQTSAGNGGGFGYGGSTNLGDGGGGGGGYYGGGTYSGSSVGNDTQGGGGGSSYIAGVSNGTTQSGIRSGHGSVKISYDATSPGTYSNTVDSVPNKVLSNFTVSSNRTLSFTDADGTSQREDYVSNNQETLGFSDFGIQVTLDSTYAPSSGLNGTNMEIAAGRDLQIGVDNDINHQLQLGISSVTASGLRIDGSQVLDIDQARAAITSLDDATDMVNQERSYLGSMQNRLSFIMSNLTGQTQNVEVSRSSIEDTDFAADATDLAKNQILAQSATAMLAQASAISQNILSLVAA